MNLTDPWRQPSQSTLDLCWAINSPALVTGEDVAAMESVDPDDIDEEQLAHFLSQQGETTRVGPYFEQLIEYWLRHVRKVEVVETGLVLRDGKVTIGEIDFLFRDEQGELVHLEAAVKFFLHIPGHEPSEYPGPNARDNYERKISKLFGSQLLASDGRVDGIGQRLGLIKGIIFYRPGETARPPPDRLPERHLRGQWLHHRDLVTMAPTAEQFAVVDKPNWLAPVADVSGLRFGELSELSSADGRPQMFSARDPLSPELETRRLFVVPDSWPDLP